MELVLRVVGWPDEVTDRPPLVAPDPQVRLVLPSELDILLPAAVAMFTEEIGVPPESVDLYRARVAELISADGSLPHTSSLAWGFINDNIQVCTNRTL